MTHEELHDLRAMVDKNPMNEIQEELNALRTIFAEHVAASEQEPQNDIAALHEDLSRLREKIDQLNGYEIPTSPAGQTSNNEGIHFVYLPSVDQPSEILETTSPVRNFLNSSWRESTPPSMAPESPNSSTGIAKPQRTSSENLRTSRNNLMVQLQQQP